MDPHVAVGLLYERQLSRAPWRNMALQIQQVAHGEMALPLAEVDEVERPAVANLILQGVDQTGLRIASVPAYTRFYPERPGQHASEQRARTRGAAMKSLHAANALPLQDRKRARWYVAYGTAPVVIRPLDGHVVWEARDPLTCFPAPSADPDAMMSDNCVFSLQRPWWWLLENYPDQARQLRRPKSIGGGEMLTLVEYVDGDTWGMYVAAPGEGTYRTFERNHGEAYAGAETPGINHSGPTMQTQKPDEWAGSEAAATLIESPNRAGVCPVVNPQRICLGRVTGQFDQMVGIYEQQAKLMALELNAVTESVFPPVWAIQNQGEQLEIVTVADGKRGIVGEIKGGTLQPIQLNPGFQTYPTIQYLDGVQRSTGGIPKDFDGDTRTHISGRRGDQVIAGVIDFPIQEAQESFSRSRWHENNVAIAVGKGHYRTKQFGFGPTWRGRGKTTWTFGDLFPDADSTAHDVHIPYPGADMNGSLIRTGQKLGLALISKQTAREDDPEIDDPELEKDRIDAEALEDALRASIQQQASQGAIPPADVARISQLVRSDRMDLADAIVQVHAEAQARQAQQAPVGAPATQPGIAQPGAGAQQSTVGPPADLTALTSRLDALRVGQMSTPQEQRAEAAVGA